MLSLSLSSSTPPPSRVMPAAHLLPARLLLELLRVPAWRPWQIQRRIHARFPLLPPAAQGEEEEKMVAAAVAGTGVSREVLDVGVVEEVDQPIIDYIANALADEDFDFDRPRKGTTSSRHLGTCSSTLDVWPTRNTASSPLAMELTI